MVIADLDIESITIFKSETDSPLVINRYGMLPFTVIGQPMQLIARRYFKVIKDCSQIDVFQFPRCSSMDVWRKCPRSPLIIQRLGVLIGESLDHASKCNASSARQSRVTFQTLFSGFYDERRIHLIIAVSFSDIAYDASLLLL